jgi:hypothetical protein
LAKVLATAELGRGSGSAYWGLELFAEELQPDFGLGSTSIVLARPTSSLGSFTSAGTFTCPLSTLGTFTTASSIAGLDK